MDIHDDGRISSFEKSKDANSIEEFLVSIDSTMAANVVFVFVVDNYVEYKPIRSMKTFSKLKKSIDRGVGLSINLVEQEELHENTKIFYLDRQLITPQAICFMPTDAIPY